MSARTKLVVVGNGMVGHRFLERLVEGGGAARFAVTVFCEEPRLAYDRVNLSKLFEAFYRVDSSHTAAIPGTGLGLTIVKAIAEHHGGRTWLDSEVGKGTTFFLLIPARREIKRGELGSELGTMA